MANGEFIEAIGKHETGWEGRINPDAWIGEFEVRRFIETIENQFV